MTTPLLELAAHVQAGDWMAALDTLPALERLLRQAAAGADELRVIGVEVTGPADAPGTAQALIHAVDRALPTILTGGCRRLGAVLASQHGQHYIFAHPLLRPSAMNEWPVITAEIGFGAWSQIEVQLSPIDPAWVEDE